MAIHHSKFSLHTPPVHVFLQHIAWASAAPDPNMQNQQDVLCVLLMIRLNAEHRALMVKRRVPCLDDYLDRVNLLLWPRFKVCGAVSYVPKCCTSWLCSRCWQGVGSYRTHCHTTHFIAGTFSSAAWYGGLVCLCKTVMFYLIGMEPTICYCSNAALVTRADDVPAGQFFSYCSVFCCRFCLMYKVPASARVLSVACSTTWWRLLVSLADMLRLLPVA